MKKLAIFLFIVLLSGCGDDVTKPTEEEEIRFRLTYRFEIPYDPILNTIGFQTITYYPEENYSTLYDEVWYDEDLPVDKPWVVQISPPDPVYFGCTREFQVEIGYKKFNEDSTFQTGYTLTHYRFPIDTIRSLADSVFYIKFPEDTSKAILIY